jgi:hypothetical protein
VPDLSHVSRGCSDYLSNGQRWAGTLVALRARLEADPFVVSAIGQKRTSAGQEARKIYRGRTR